MHPIENVTSQSTMYLPMDRRAALSSQKALPNRLEGAALFADISGFMNLTTAITEGLGPKRGAEELTRTLNHVYEALIAEVHNLRGAVISFVGDAISCWFSEDATQPDSAAVRATACAFALQDAMREFASVSTPDPNTTVSLTLKVAIASGTARRFLVGQSSIQRLETLAGDTIVRMASAEKLATSGDIVVAEEVATELGKQVSIAEWRTSPSGERFAVLSSLHKTVSDSPWPTDFSLAEEEVQTFLASPVYRRIQQGQGDFLTELRRVVPMFVKFSGIDYDHDEHAEEKLNQFISWAQSVLQKYEGYLMRVTVGDKGSFFYATFGALLAHEDDADRAAAAALELLERPAQLAFIRELNIGISQGQARSGAYGSSVRHIYGIQGTEVNNAARLMSRASAEQVLLTERAARALSGFALKDLGKFQLKGWETPRSLFALAGTRKESVGTFETLKGRELTEMVGRQTELTYFNKALEELKEGTGSHVIVEGEAGIGKSRLVAELLQSARERDVRYLVGAGDAIDKATSYHAWRPVFRELFGYDALEGLQTAETQERIKEHQKKVLARLEAINPDLLERAPLLNVVLPLDLTDNDLTAQMAGEVRATNTASLLTAILKYETQQQPTLLVLEDMHWMDSQSWALTLQVYREVRSILMAMITRPLGETPPREFAQINGDENTTFFGLETLSAEEIRKLLSLRFGVAEFPAEIFDFIQAKAEGHPFFSEELAYALRDTGFLLVEQGVCSLAPDVVIEELDFPDTIEGVITSRIDRLDEQHQLALKVASVIGRVFAFRLLRDIHPVEADKSPLRDILKKLESLELTPLDTPEPELAYIFKHIITREVAYHLMANEQRRPLHEQVALWYESHHTEDLNSYYPTLVFHWSQAENEDKHLEYLELAGQQALLDNANKEAVEFLKQAREIRQKRDDGSRNSKIALAKLAQQLAQGYTGLGDIQLSIDFYREAVELVEEPEPTSKTGLYLQLGKQVGAHLLRRILPEGLLSRSEDSVDAASIAAGSYFALNNSYFFVGNQMGSYHGILRSLNIVESMKNKSQLAGQLASSYAAAGAAIFSQIHSPWLPDIYYKRAQKYAEESESLFSQWYVYFADGYLKLVHGYWEDAEEKMTRALETAETLGSRRSSNDTLAGLIYIQYNRGNYAECLKLAKRCFEDAKASEDRQYQSQGLANQGLVHLLYGETEKALDLLEQACSLADMQMSPAEYIHAHGLKGRALLRLGRYADAWDALKTGEIQGFPGTIPGFEGLSSMVDVSLALLELKPEDESIDLQEVREFAERNIPVLKKTTDAYSYIHQPRADVFLGLLQHIDGKTDEALKLWSTQLRTLKNKGLYVPYDEARLNYELARLTPTHDSMQKTYLQRAEVLFQQLGAEFDLGLVQEQNA